MKMLRVLDVNLFEVCFRDLQEDFHQANRLLKVLHFIFESLIRVISSCIYSPSFFHLFAANRDKKNTPS